MVELLDAFLAGGLAVTASLLAWVVFRLARRPSRYDPESLETALRASFAQSSETFKGAFATSIKELGLIEDMGSIKSTAQQILDSASSLQTLFQVKRGRAQFAEFHLEELLRDVFPSGRLGIRKRLPGIGIPDASLDTPEGIVCIDAKFPLDNYRRMVEAQDERQRRQHAKRFAADVRRHVDKIADDYVKPEEGGVPFALGFIPAEAVYHYLAESEGGLLRDAASRGVTVVSPSTLVASLNLLGASLRAQEIAEKAKDIEDRLRRLERGFEEFEGDWKTLRTHLNNAYGRMVDADKSYGNLRRAFRRVVRLEDEATVGAPPKRQKYW